MPKQIESRGGHRRGAALPKLVGGVIALVVIGGGAWLVLAGGGDEQSAGERSSDIALAQVRDFEITTLAGGDLEARNQIEIRSELERQAAIVEVIPEGTRVRKGELLVRLNSDTIENEVAEEELRVEEARLALEAAQTDVQIQISDNESAMRRAALDLELKRLALEQWRQGEDKQTRKSNELAIERAQRELERLTDKWEQTQRLYKQEFISKNEYDQDRLAFIEAKAELEKAQLADVIYREYQYPRDEKQKLSDVDEAEAEVERVEQQNEINLKAKQSTLANRQRQLAMREENLAEEKDQLAKCTIHAPQDGLVVYGSTAQRDNWRWQNEGPLAIGRNVGPNDLLIVLPDTSEMVASVKVHESLAGQIRPGQKATVSVEALNLDVPGTVESIGVLAESGGWRDPNRREYTVKIALDGRDQTTLKPSMRCEARLILSQVDDALSVPVQAVFNDGAVAFVYTPRGMKFERTPVVVGRRSDTYAEIKSGLSERQAVLVRKPGPGEVFASEWDNAELEALGYQIGEDGKPRAPFNPAMMMSRPGGSPPGADGQRPGRGGERSGAQQGAQPDAQGSGEKNSGSDTGTGDQSTQGASRGSPSADTEGTTETADAGSGSENDEAPTTSAAEASGD